jgi:O-antigen ligase
MPDEPDRVRTRRRRVQNRRQFAGADRICEALLVTVVIGSVLAIGTVHIPVLLAVSALALVGGTLGALAGRQLPIPAIVLGALGLFSVFQALPLPAAWVLRVSPISAQVWLRCLTPFGEEAPTRFPISLDAGASVAEALKWLTYAAVYVMAARVRSRRGSAWLAALLFTSAALVALITLLHGAADVHELYGLYRPNFKVERWNLGPLLNSNNFAGYANLGIFAGAGLLLGGRTLLPRVPSLVGLGVLVSALLLSGSRGGILSALVCGGVVVVWLATVQGVRPSVRRLLAGAAPLLLGLAGAIVLGTAKNWDSVASVDVRRKVAVWRWSVPMIREHAWLGVGRGAFETAFPPYRQALDYDWTAVFSHAENFIVQWLAEWGIPIGLCALLAVVGYILHEWYGAKGDRLRFLLLTGLAALFLQNLVDLGLEIPSVAIAAIVALAAGERASEPAPSGQSWGPSVVAASVPFFAVWMAAVLWSRRPVELERREFSRSYRDLAVEDLDERDAFRGQLRAAMLRHPGESFFPLLGSIIAYRARDAKPLPWIARALELGPTNGRVHFVLALFLGAHKATAQAMLHLRLAAQYDRTLSAAAGVRAAEWAPTLEVLLEAIPNDATGDDMLATACTKVRRVELKIGCFRQAAARNADDLTVRGQFADSLLVALRSRQWPCNGALAEGCAQEVDHTARAMAKLDGKSWRPGYLMAKLLLLRGDTKTAATLLARVCPSDENGKECAREAVSAAIASGSDEAILAASDRYAARTCEDGASCAAALDWLGRTLEGGGKVAFAINYYSKAAETEGTAARWLQVADRATQANLLGVARAALERADHSPDANANSKAHSELLMRRIARDLAAGSF